MSTPKEISFQNLLATFDTAMLTTQTKAGALRTRPMQVADITGGCDVWFVSDVDSAKAFEIASNPNVNLAFQGNRRYLSLSGRAKLVNDRQRIHDLWNEAWKVWFPDGRDDPSLTLIRVEASRGEYWDLSGTNSLSYWLDAGKAFFTGTRPEVDDPVHGKVALR